MSLTRRTLTSEPTIFETAMMWDFHDPVLEFEPQSSLHLPRHAPTFTLSSAPRRVVVHGPPQTPRLEQVYPPEIESEGSGAPSEVKNLKTMAAQRAVDALNPTFGELKSKNEETRLRASYDLRNLVIAAHRGD